jgi:hypothetical protein
VVRMFIRHQVADYGAWRAVYDGLDPARIEMGASGHEVFQAIDDPNNVTAWHDFSTQEAADAFAHSPQLHEAMQQAGVQGTPDVWFTTSAA